MKKSLLVVFLIVFLSGCATPEVVQIRKATDNKLSCVELKYEISEAEDYLSRARKEKGLTGTNAAAVLFFWPALIGTYMNAGEAIDGAQAPIKHLHSLNDRKDC